MAYLDELIISLRTQLCIAGLSEDAIQALVAGLQISTPEGSNRTIVTANGGIDVQFIFGSDGNFMGAYAQIMGRSIPLVFGVGSTNLQVFKGSPSGTNPGPGWEVEVELTKAYLGQSGAENTWEIFYASRVGVLNTF